MSDDNAIFTISGEIHEIGEERMVGINNTWPVRDFAIKFKKGDLFHIRQCQAVKEAVIVLAFLSVGQQVIVSGHLRGKEHQHKDRSRYLSQRYSNLDEVHTIRKGV